MNGLARRPPQLGEVECRGATNDTGAEYDGVAHFKL
jgi:hypothetical protein